MDAPDSRRRNRPRLCWIRAYAGNATHPVQPVGVGCVSLAAEQREDVAALGVGAPQLEDDGAGADKPRPERHDLGVDGKREVGVEPGAQCALLQEVGRAREVCGQHHLPLRQVKLQRCQVSMLFPVKQWNLEDDSAELV